MSRFHCSGHLRFSFLPPSSQPALPGQHSPTWPCFTQHTVGTQLSSLHLAALEEEPTVPLRVHLSKTNSLPPSGFWKRLHRRSHPWLILCQLTHLPPPSLLISPIRPGSGSSPCANFSPSPVFIPFRCLQAIIMYPLSQPAHIKFFSSLLINQSLNPSEPFNCTSCFSLNSIQFLQVSDSVVTQGWIQRSSC